MVLLLALLGGLLGKIPALFGHPVLEENAFSGIIGRLAAYGISPNKTAALGENIALMVNLVLLAAGYVRFLTWRSHYETVIVRASFRRGARPFPVA